MSCLIEAKHLAEILCDDDVVILDCRYDLSDRESGRRRYDAGHIPGAMYVSLDEDCCAAVGIHGGRHPLPALEVMAELFGRLGIRRGESTVVCYDDEGACYAAHLWWMLRFAGHDNVFVLNGGFSAWIASGGLLSSEATEVRKEEFLPLPRQHYRVSMEEVRDRRDAWMLVDCRAPERYSGETETIDPVAGHIPGAINIPWRDLIDESGRFRTTAALADCLTGVGACTVLYCGSGVTACVNALAAVEAGLDIPRLYDGSWSDWISWPENPVQRHCRGDGHVTPALPKYPSDHGG
jgi:thiosulfate/3-mercaptopyruvate sulfurtransferase